MLSEVIKKGTDHIAETGEFNLLDKVEVDQGIRKIIGMIKGEKILEVTWKCIKILKDRIVKGNIVEITGMKIIAEKEIGAGLEKDHFHGILLIEGMTEAQTTVDQGQD